MNYDERLRWINETLFDLMCNEKVKIEIEGEYGEVWGTLHTLKYGDVKEEYHAYAEDTAEDALFRMLQDYEEAHRTLSA